MAYLDASITIPRSTHWLVPLVIAVIVTGAMRLAGFDPWSAGAAGAVALMTYFLPLWGFWSYILYGAYVTIFLTWRDYFGVTDEQAAGMWRMLYLFGPAIFPGTWSALLRYWLRG